ncbi:sugar phosphate isomerase/epimerase family protein [Haloferula sp.]|uniref:sugar phosphate isomerase/epimerase family protein n=1 Tax=Haloferula sp. TaxID=2497595 RepID=UPI00329DD37F
MKRREFMVMGAAAGAAKAMGANTGEPAKLALGYDNYAVRGMKWKAPALIDYAAKMKVDSLFISDLDAFESLDDAHLIELRKRAEGKGVKLTLGTWSVCPTSPSFKDKWGTADEHLQLGIRATKALGSPVLRVILGSAKDRKTDGGIEARIADMVAVLKRNKERAVDAGMKIAVENHAGDMHSMELKSLVEAAGPDYVGVNLDSGNAVWCLETPQQNLENLGKYVLTTSLRDSAVWKSEHGVTVQWTAMGEGMVDWKSYFKRFAELCPNAAVNIETISGFNREFPLNSDSFKSAQPEGAPGSMAEFSQWAATGTPRKPWQAPKGGDRKKAEQGYQLDELERSLTYCRSLGLGRRKYTS